MTEAEMRDWLARREEDPAEVDRIVSFLTRNLALDDRRFSHAFAEDKRNLSGWGASRIESTLRQRGIDPDLAREAAAVSSESEVDRAIRLLGERGVTAATDRERGRALGLLARRGYSVDDAYAAIRRVEAVSRAA